MSKKNSKYAYLANLLTESLEETDRAAVILLGAEIDELLRKILQKRILIQDNNDKSPDVLSSMGALSSFSARIQVVYRLGLLDSLVAHDLHIIRKIRNLFAHRTHGLSFMSDEPRKLVQKFKIANFELPSGSFIVSVDMSKTRDAFQSISFFLLGHLDSLQKKTRRLKEKRILSEVVD